MEIDWNQTLVVGEALERIISRYETKLKYGRLTPETAALLKARLEILKTTKGLLDIHYAIERGVLEDFDDDDETAFILAEADALSGRLRSLLEEERKLETATIMERAAKAGARLGLADEEHTAQENREAASIGTIQHGDDDAIANSLSHVRQTEDRKGTPHPPPEESALGHADHHADIYDEARDRAVRAGYPPTKHPPVWYLMAGGFLGLVASSFVASIEPAAKDAIITSGITGAIIGFGISYFTNKNHERWVRRYVQNRHEGRNR